MSRAQRKHDLVSFLRTIQRPDSPIGDLDEHENLVDSGLTDSLAVLQIITWLEENHGIDFLDSGIDPADLGSVADILDLIERHAA